MKQLRKFEVFDINAFLNGKTLGLLKVEPLQNEAKKTIGSRATVFVMNDNTNYGKDKNGNIISGINVGDTFTVKTPQTVDDLPFTVGQTVVNLTNIKKASVWGDFRSNLSVTGKLDLAK